MMIGITPEYTTGDKVISWSVFIYSFIYKFLISFLLVVIWNLFSPWNLKWWSGYFFIVYLAIPLAAAAVTTVWFTFGGIKDMFRLFRDLKARIDNPLDNGQVVGNVSLADAEVFSKLAGEKEEAQDPDKQ